MPENQMEVGVKFFPDMQSVQQSAKLAGAVFGKEISKGGSRGLMQGFNSNTFTEPLGRITGKANEFEKSMAAANARVIAFGAATAPIFLMAEAFHKLVDSTVEVEKTMTDINAVFGLSASGLSSFTSQLFEAANKTGQSFNLASTAAAEFARQGLNVQETLDRTSAALILNKISGLGMGEAVSSITSILNSFSKEALNATDIINRMTSVDLQFAISAADLSEALKRVGSSANDANVSFNQTVALVTAARQITGREAAVIGNSFKTMFTRLARPKVLEDLEEIGIQTRDLNGKVLPLTETLKNLSTTYQGLAQSQKSFISEAVGGVYQINILKATMRDQGSQMSLYKQVLDATTNSTDAVTKRMGLLNSTLSAGLVRTMNDLSLASSSVGQAMLGNSMKSGIDFFDKSFKTVAHATDKDNTGLGAQTTQAGLKGVGNWLAGPGLQMGIGLILKLLTELATFAKASGKDILGLDKSTKEKEAIEARVFQYLSKTPAVMDQIINKQRTLNSVTQEILGVSLAGNKGTDIVQKTSGYIAEQLVGKNLTKMSGASAGGFVPNLSPVQSEMRMAAQGGYVAGNVIATQIQNGNHRLNTVANTNETKSMVFSDGKQYEFVNPPYGSHAGRQHERESVRKTGINPYSLAQMPLSGGGFVPNLVYGHWITPGGTMIPTDDHNNTAEEIIRKLHKTGQITPQEYAEYKKISGFDPILDFNIPYTFLHKKNYLRGVTNRAMGNYSVSGIEGQRLTNSQRKELKNYGIENGTSVMHLMDKYDPLRGGETIYQHGAGGFVPNLAQNISKQKLQEMLMGNHKFSHLQYWSNNDQVMKSIYAAQHSTVVKNSEKQGKAPPMGYSSWTEYQLGEGRFIARGRMDSPKGAYGIKNLSLDAIKKAHINGEEYNIAAKGYIPLMDALRRENKATGGHAKVSFDPRLVSGENPFGFAAIDGRNQRSAAHAISQHLSGGQSLGDVKKAHTASGFVPNLAMDSGFTASLLLSIFGGASKSATTSGYMDKMITLAPAFFTVTQKEIAVKRKLVEELDAMNGKLLSSTGKSQTFHGQTFNSLAEVDQSALSAKIDVFRKDIQKSNEEQSASMESTRGTGFKMANFTSLGGAVISQAAGTLISPTAGAAVDSFITSATSAGQAMMAFPNKIGKGLALGFGATAVLNFVDTLNKNAETTKIASDKQLTQIKNITDNLQLLSQTSSNLSSLYLDAGTTMETLNKESKKFSDTLGLLGAMKGGQQLVGKILAAPDSDSRLAAIENVKFDKTKEANTIASLQNLRDLMQSKQFLGMSYVPGLQEDKGFSYQNYFDKDLVKQQLVETAITPISNMSKEEGESLTGAVDSLDKFKETLDSISKNNPVVGDYLKEARKQVSPVGYEQIIQEIRANLTQRKIIGENPEIQNLIKSSRSKAQSSQIDVDSAIKSQQYLRRLFLNQGGMSSENLLNNRQMLARGQYQTEGVRLSGLEAQSSLFAQTHGERTVAQREYGINTQKNANETRNALTSLNIDTNKSVVGALTQNFDQTFGKLNTKENINGEQNLGISDIKALSITAINAGLASVLKGSGGDVIGKFSKNGQFDFQAFSKAASVAGTSNSLVQKRVENYLNSQQSVDILKTLNGSNLKQAEILQDFKTKSLEESQRLTAAIKEAHFKELTSFMGGIANLGDRKSMREMQRNEMRGASLMNASSPEARAQGAKMVLDSLTAQGIHSDSNKLFAKAHRVFLERGAETEQRAGARIGGVFSDRFGANSDEAIGIQQANGSQNVNEAVAAMFSKAYQPEGRTSEDEKSGAFINSAEYLKPFDNGIKDSTASLMNFPNAINTTIEALQKATADIEGVRAKNNEIISKEQNSLATTIQKVLDQNKEKANSPDIGQQTNWITKMIPGITTAAGIIGPIVGPMIMAKMMGGGFFKTRGAQLGELNALKGVKVAGAAESVGETVMGGASSYERTGAGPGFTFRGSRVPGATAGQAGSMAEELFTPYGRPQRGASNLNFPKTILSDVGQPTANKFSGVKPMSNVTKPNGIFKIEGNFDEIKGYSSKIESLEKQFYDEVEHIKTQEGKFKFLKDEYTKQVERIAQDIHLGNQPNFTNVGGVSSNVKRAAGFSNWKGLGKSTIMERLSEMGVNTKSYQSPWEQSMRQISNSKINSISTEHSQTLEKLNKARENINRFNSASYEKTAAENIRGAEAARGLHQTGRAATIAEAMAEKARTPANLLRQDLLRKASQEKFEKSSFEEWKRKISQRNSEIKFNDPESILNQAEMPAYGESSIPRNFKNITKGYQGTTGAPMSSGLFDKAASSFYSNLTNKIKPSSLIKAALTQSKLENGLMSLPQFALQKLKMDKLGKINLGGLAKWGAGMGVGLLGGMGIDKVTQLGVDKAGGDTTYKGMGAQATGDLAQIALAMRYGGVAGSVVTGAGIIGNRAIDIYGQNRQNREAQELMGFKRTANTSESTFGSYIAHPYEHMFGGQFENATYKAQYFNKDKRKASHEASKAIADKTHELEQKTISEKMGLDTNFSQGAAKQSYHDLQSELGYARGKNGQMDFSKLSETGRKTWQELYKSQNLGKADVFKAGDLAKNVINDYSGSQSPYLKGLMGEKSKYMPTALNATSYNGKTRELSGRDNLTVGDYSNIGKEESGGKVDKMIEILNTLAAQGVNKEGAAALEQNVNFSALPININITNGTQGLTSDVAAQVQQITDTLAKSLYDLGQRMSAVDKQVQPSTVK